MVLPLPSPDGTGTYYIFLGIVSYGRWDLNKKKYEFLINLKSFIGFECARANFPGIYTRVSPSFITWIQGKISQ